MSDEQAARASSVEPEDDPADEELAVRTVELDTDDSGTVVIAQQNMAGRRQAGGGEYKNVGRAPSVDEASAEQDRVDAATDAVGAGTAEPGHERETDEDSSPRP